METSLRYGRDSKALRIHAKEKFPLNSRTVLQVHGELDTRDTRMGGPSFVGAMIRFNPDLSTSLGAGVQYDKHEMLTYGIRAKKTFPVTRNVTGDNSLNFNIKGWCKIDKEFKEKKSKGAAEFVWSIFNFRKDQDIRLKIGYEVTDKVPYLQIRENNWTLNADMDGRWNVRFDL